MEILLSILTIAVFLFCILILCCVIFCGSFCTLLVPNMADKKSLKITGCVLLVASYILATAFLPHINTVDYLLETLADGRAEGAFENVAVNISAKLLEYLLIPLKAVEDFLFEVLGLSYTDDGSDIAENWKTYLIGFVIPLISYFIIVFVTRTGDKIVEQDLKDARAVDERNSRKEKDIRLETSYEVDYNGNISSSTKIVDKTKYENYSFTIFSFIGSFIFSSIFLSGGTLVFLIVGLVRVIFGKK